MQSSKRVPNRDRRRDSGKYEMTSVGITGHRSLNDVGAITQEIDAALIQIRETCPAPFIVFSALAEGADRLVVRRAFDLLGASLKVILPLNQADYTADFPEDDSLAEFLELLTLAVEVVELPPTPTRNSAYEAAGRYILKHVDLLIAVWDGQQPRGRGGTGQIVVEAQQSQLPVVWIKMAR
jgi:hypothetical protein